MDQDWIVVSMKQDDGDAVTKEFITCRQAGLQRTYCAVKDPRIAIHIMCMFRVVDIAVRFP